MNRFTRVASFVAAVGLAAPVLAQGALQAPGEFQVPRGNWQVPGEFQQPAGPWLTPAAFQTPGAVQPVTEACSQRLIVGTDTLFAFDAADLGPEAEVTLAALATEIAGIQGRVTIEGHTDAKGAEDYNIALSERRAGTVRDWLAGHSAVPAETPIRGEGEARPVAPNTLPDGADNPDGRALNRRVEVVVATCG